MTARAQRAAAQKARLVTVCDACLTSSCWLGIHMCWASQNAGTTERTVAELDALGREHRSYYSVGLLREHGAATTTTQTQRGDHESQTQQREPNSEG